eukprot:CAMPEP_0206229646 /NCGR_PEP_ID=MMETSP0047_2-20121206/9814_1 /ASSEMBLY_ACC=CAM_ASM_000192 /TAXON_ID=195065 /ORGANISM="Chroomonas mesostigmatica_cf, Strain CCMP1168" /LENGTH=214 /DNA_ID=CAMNT_0053652971 /DNA_START=13 /DNA_END=657 /DNA_ORIENTATION=-
MKPSSLLALAMAFGMAAVGTAFAPAASLQLRTAPSRAGLGSLKMRSAEGAAPAWRIATVAAALAVFLGGGVADVAAVSGGVADFSDVQDQDFSGKDLRKKDFSSANCRNAKFVKSNLKGARFFKADMQGADLTDADLSNGSIENAKLQGVLLTNAVLKNAYTGIGLEQVKDIKNADFTGAQIRPDVLIKLCGRADASGTNPKTGADTRESLECP